MARAHLDSTMARVGPLHDVIEQVVLAPADGARLDPVQPSSDGLVTDVLFTVAATEREQILAALHATGWVLDGPHGAAARLAMNRTALQSKMKKLGILKAPGDTKAAPNADAGLKSTAKMVPQRNVKRTVTDGPFAETHELLGG